MIKFKKEKDQPKPKRMLKWKIQDSVK